MVKWAERSSACLVAFEENVVPRDRIELSTPAFSGRQENEEKQEDKKRKA